MPTAVNWFSLVFVRSVRNVWIRSLGAVPRTWDIKESYCFARDLFVIGNLETGFAKGQLRPEYKDKAPVESILAGHLLSKATVFLHLRELVTVAAEEVGNRNCDYAHCDTK